MQKLCSYANELTVATLLCVDVCQGIGITKMLDHSEPTQKLTKLEFKVVNDQILTILALLFWNCTETLRNDVAM